LLQFHEASAQDRVETRVGMTQVARRLTYRHGKSVRYDETVYSRASRQTNDGANFPNFRTNLEHRHLTMFSSFKRRLVRLPPVMYLVELI
jgi:hypothetical protein